MIVFIVQLLLRLSIQLYSIKSILNFIDILPVRKLDSKENI